MGSDLSSSSIAFKETLELLEWPTVCAQLSTFASSHQGRRHCKELSLPADFATSRIRLSETLEIGLLDNSLEGGLSFKGVHDIEETLFCCEKGGLVSGEELLGVAETLGAARRLRRQLYDSELRPTISALLVDFATLPELEKHLKFGLEEGGRVADRASVNLGILRQKNRELIGQRNEALNQLIRRCANFLQDSVVAERNGRSVIAVKASFASKIPGLVHDTSASGSTLFIEPQGVISLSNQIAQVRSLIVKEEQFLLKEWSHLVGQNFVQIEKLSKTLLQLDLALARARYGQWIKGVPPILYEESDGSFSLPDLRHPLLVWNQICNKGAEVVPVTLEISTELRVVAITGPNTGGKTVTLKSIGLAVLMARAGMLLACSGEPLIPWCNQVLADIGDEQSLQQSLSTFSSHINRISRIFQALEEKAGSALVLLDEVGAGTDPREGTALAIALLKTLADRVRLTIATTHFGELKALKYTDPRFENASVAFDSETITPTYTLQWGIPGRSNAISIACRLGLDKEIISRAEKFIANNESPEVNKVIIGLEEQRRIQQSATEEAVSLLARAELLHDQLLEQWEKQCKQSAEVQEMGRQELESSIRDGQREVRNLIKRLRAEGANGETARRVGQRLRRLEGEHFKTTSNIAKNAWSPQVGERIRLISLDKAAEVISISEDGLYLNVLCGVFRSTVHLDAVESLDGRKSKPIETVVQIRSTKYSGNSSTLRTKRNTIDVRGLRVHEAEVVVEEYFRKAISPVWVVHGIGSGKLKKGLRKWFDDLEYVKEVSDAEQQDGGSGCTVVWMH